MTALSLLATFLRDRRAVSSAEFAMVVPLFIILIFGTINGSIMMSAVNQMHFASERAARCMSVDVGTTCDDVDAYAKSMYNGPSLTDLTFAPTTGLACGNQVVGSGSYELFIGVSATSITISATACYPLI